MWVCDECLSIFELSESKDELRELIDLMRAPEEDLIVVAVECPDEDCHGYFFVGMNIVKTNSSDGKNDYKITPLEAIIPIKSLTDSEFPTISYPVVNLKSHDSIRIRSVIA